jgi:hypothetical protein
MQQRLALPTAAGEITARAMFLQLRHMTPNRTPPADLA